MAQIIPFRGNKSNALPPADDNRAINLTIEGSLAEEIRYSAGMVCKSPEQFVRDWLLSGFPEHAA